MKETELIETLRQENEDYRNLEAEHRALDEKLTELEAKSFLLPEEESEVKSLKKQKLTKKDQMAGIVREYREKK